MLLPPVEPGQYTSIELSERLDEAGIAASVGAVGTSYSNDFSPARSGPSPATSANQQQLDNYRSINALAETINGLFKTELIKPRGPWRSSDEVEFATAEWVDWYNHRRLYEYCGDMPPVDLENLYYDSDPALQPAELTTT